MGCRNFLLNHWFDYFEQLAALGDTIASCQQDYSCVLYNYFDVRFFPQKRVTGSDFYSFWKQSERPLRHWAFLLQF